VTRASAVSALVLVVALAAGSSGHARSVRSTCTPRSTTVGGKPAKILCGPAKATVQYGGKTYRFAGGTCSKIGFWNLYIGTKVTGGASPHLFFAFGEVKRDGTYPLSKFEVGFQEKGVAYDLHNGSVTLSGNLTKGTFKGGSIVFGNGKAGAPGQSMSGAFSCSGNVPGTG
jgi:hypothetical protein